MRARRANLRTLAGVIQFGIILVYGEVLLAGILRQQIGFPAGEIVYDTALALIACAVVGLMGAWPEIGFRWPDSWRTLWWFSPLVFDVVYELHHWHIYASFWDTATFALLYMAQSIQMRVIFDGLMVRSLLPLGRWIAAILPALLQAVLITVDFALVPPEDGYVPLLLLVAASTAASGFAYAALRIRTGLLWPLIITDVAAGIVNDLTLTPNASPYPLTTVRVAYYSAAIAFGLVVGSVVLLSARQPEPHTVDVADGRPPANRVGEH